MATACAKMAISLSGSRGRPTSRVPGAACASLFHQAHTFHPGGVMLAAAYIRKSNDQQDRTEDVKSVATRRDLVAAFAASRGWTLDEKYIFADDGITGALFAERLGLQALLAATRT